MQNASVICSKIGIYALIIRGIGVGMFASSAYAFSSGFKEALHAKIKAGPPAWMAQQISEDFKSFRKGISKADIDQTSRALVRRAHCTITGGKVFIKNNADHEVTSNRVILLEKILSKLLQAVKLPDMEFLVDLLDASQSPVKRAPVLCISKRKTETNVVHMPDFVKYEGSIWLIKQVYQGNEQYPWSQKRAGAFWRGSTTDAGLSPKFFIESSIRAQLIMASLKYPKMINARFSAVAQENSWIGGLLRKKGFYGPKVSIQDHLQFKYLLALDGTTWPSSFFWQLWSNSLTFKQDSPFTEWYYAALRPYVHYVPVDRNLSNCRAQIKWASRHEQKALTMVKEANMFAQKYLKRIDLYYYLYLVLKEYARLQS